MSDNRFVLTKYKGGVLAFAIDVKKNRLESVCFCKAEDLHGESVGNIYLARVTRVSNDINAAFINYDEGKNAKSCRGFLPLGQKNAKPLLANREYDGALRSGDLVLVRLDKEAVRTKEPVFSFAQKSDRLDEIISNSGREGKIGLLLRAPAVYLSAICDSRFEYGKIVTDDEELFLQASEFLAEYAPDMLGLLSMYSDASYPLSKLYSVETKLSELLSKRVWLKSGAYLVIEKTEAMYVVDVNSGKNISRKSNAEYIYDINIEAARELMRQIRLRNLTGIIIVDFISMESAAHKKQLMSELKSLAGLDSVPTSVVDMTALDLVEITRKKNRKPLWDQLY